MQTTSKPSDQVAREGLSDNKQQPSTKIFDKTRSSDSKMFPFALRKDAFEVVPQEKLEGEKEGDSGSADGEDQPMPEILAQVQERKQKADEEK